MNQVKKYQKKNKVVEEVKGEENQVRKLIILIVSILIILGLIYLVATLFEKKDYSSIFKNSLEVSDIQYDEIIIGNMLNQKEDNYYVLVLDKEDPYYDTFLSYIENYKNLEYKTRIYSVDLNNVFNKNNKVDDANPRDLTFKTTTLVEVSKGRVKDYIEDSDEIGSIIVSLAKESEPKEA